MQQFIQERNVKQKEKRMLKKAKRIAARMSTELMEGRTYARNKLMGSQIDGLVTKELEALGFNVKIEKEEDVELGLIAWIPQQ